MSNDEFVLRAPLKNTKEEEEEETERADKEQTERLEVHLISPSSGKSDIS